MGHLSTSMWVKVHNNENPFTGLEFTIFTIYMYDKSVTKMFEKVKIWKGPAGLELVTYKFVTNGLTNWAMLLDNNFWLENIKTCKIILYFIAYFDQKCHNMGVSHTTLLMNY